MIFERNEFINEVRAEYFKEGIAPPNDLIGRVNQNIENIYLFYAESKPSKRLVFLIMVTNDILKNRITDDGKYCLIYLNEDSEQRKKYELTHNMYLRFSAELKEKLDELNLAHRGSK